MTQDRQLSRFLAYRRVLGKQIPEVTGNLPEDSLVAVSVGAGDSQGRHGRIQSKDV